MDLRPSRSREPTKRRVQVRPRATRPLGLLAVLALAVVIGAGSAGPAYAASTITVDCTADPSALASALATASDGDTLAIQGTCKGTFEVAHSVSLAGSGGATLDGQSAGSVVTVDPGVTVAISGLTITDGAARFGPNAA